MSSTSKIPQKFSMQNLHGFIWKPTHTHIFIFDHFSTVSWKKYQCGEPPWPIAMTSHCHHCVCICHSSRACYATKVALFSTKFHFIGDFKLLLLTIWRHLNGWWNPMKSRSRYRDNLVEFQVLRNYMKQYDTGMLCIIIHAHILWLNRTREYIRDYSLQYF